jgi:hypothetical protein
MILYADTSALVKRYILESGSLEIASVFENLAVNVTFCQGVLSGNIYLAK